MKTKTFNISIENIDYFGLAVLTSDKKVYLKYFRFTLENGIENLENCRIKVSDKKAIDEIYKTVQSFYFDKDREIKMYSY